MVPPPRRADPADATRALRNHLGALAARHMRRLWHQRIWGTPDVPPDQRTLNFADAVL